MSEKQIEKINERLKLIVEELKKKGISQRQFALAVGIDPTAITKYTNGNRGLKPEVISNIVLKFNISYEWLISGAGLIYNSRLYTQKGNSTIDIGKGQFVIVMPLIEKQTQARYLLDYNNEQFLAELPVHCITVNQLHEQYYKAFVVYGDDMNNNTAESICEGDIVVGCEIEQHKWKTTLAANTFKDYIIVHKEGILIKRIIAFDAKTDVVISKSLNPDKNSYPDFDIKLAEVFQIFYVVSVTNPR